jgi:hypothetical protein
MSPFVRIFFVDSSSSRGGGKVGNAVFAFSKEEGKSPRLVLGDFPSSGFSTACLSAAIMCEFHVAAQACSGSSVAKDDS